MNDEWVAEADLLNRGDTKNKVPQWYMYFMCGVRGVTEHLGTGDPIGMPGTKIIVIVYECPGKVYYC